MSAATRTYARHVVPTMVVYVGLICVVPFIIYALAASGPLLWVLAALPAVPLCAVFWQIGRLLADMEDEYLRLLEIRKALIATGFALSLASVWGFLEVYAGAPHVPMNVVPVAWFAGLALGSAINAVIERRAAS